MPIDSADGISLLVCLWCHEEGDEIYEAECEQISEGSF